MIFEHETFILREEGSGTKQEMEKAEIHGVPVFKNVDVIARMNSTETIKQAVAGGWEFPSCPGWLPGKRKKPTG